MHKPSNGTLPHSRLPAIILSLLILAVVGLADYLADFIVGYDLSLSTCYLLAISFALWNVGAEFAVFVSIMSVVCSLAGDCAAGEKYPNGFVSVWNSAFLLASYLFVIWLLARLKSFNQTLEAGIRERTAALANEMIERARLEKEILTISEREQQRIGRELHDSLCQHLTATALAGQVLEEKLAERSQPEVEDSRHIIELVEQGSVIARNLASGLLSFEIEADGLVTALHDLAEMNSVRPGVVCYFDAKHAPLIRDPFTVTHLYRIAQEAVRNAVRYSGARRIVISLTEIEHGAKLKVEDDGCGIQDLTQERKGMGLKIMRHRAALIGGKFEIKSDSCGTAIACIIATVRDEQSNLSK